jgi:hypothetical protein
VEYRVTLGALPKAYGTHEMILPILCRVADVLVAAGRGDQMGLFLERAEACPCREELVRLAKGCLAGETAVGE